MPSRRFANHVCGSCIGARVIVERGPDHGENAVHGDRLPKTGAKRREGICQPLDLLPFRRVLKDVGRARFVAALASSTRRSDYQAGAGNGHSRPKCVAALAIAAGQARLLAPPGGLAVPVDVYSSFPVILHGAPTASTLPSMASALPKDAPSVNCACWASATVPGQKSRTGRRQ